MPIFDPNQLARVLTAQSPMQGAAAKAQAAWDASQGTATPIATKEEYAKALRVKEGIDPGAGGDFSKEYYARLNDFQHFNDVASRFRPEFAGDSTAQLGGIYDALDSKYNNPKSHPVMANVLGKLGIAKGRSDFWEPYKGFMTERAANLSSRLLAGENPDENISARTNAATSGEDPTSVQQKLDDMRALLGRRVLNAFVLETSGRNPLLADRARKFIAGAKDREIEKSLPPDVLAAKQAVEKVRSKPTEGPTGLKIVWH